MQKKISRTRQTRKCLLSKKKGQAAADKRRKWRENHGHVDIFAKFL